MFFVLFHYNEINPLVALLKSSLEFTILPEQAVTLPTNNNQ